MSFVFRVINDLKKRYTTPHNYWSDYNVKKTVLSTKNNVRERAARASLCSIDMVLVIRYTLPMKSAIMIFLICIQPVMSHAHPGKTDRYGGHKCLKGCEAWGLFYQEYHLHDKDGRPIRVKSNAKVKETGTGAMIEPVSKPTETIVQADTPKTAVVTTTRYITNVYEENIFLSNPLLVVLLVLLLLLLILQLTQKRKER